MVEVCLPGTGGMIPLPNRWLSCCWIEFQGKAILIDCGEGTQIALRQSGCKLSRLDVLFITHFHADHIAGLPGLLLTLGNFGKTSPLTIIGPKGLEQVVAALCTIAPILPYPLELIELDLEAGTMKKGDFEFSYLPLKHGIPCLAYHLSVLRKPIFNPQKALALGVPKPLFSRLHAGHSVEMENGTFIEPEQVLDGDRNPIRICYVTDTGMFPELIGFAQDADLLISEGMYGDDAMRGKMEQKGHMLFSDSAMLAKESGTKKLWLTHYSPALLEPEQYLEFAQTIFPHTVATYDGIRMVLSGR